MRYAVLGGAIVARTKSRRKKSTGAALAFQRKINLLIGLKMQWQDENPLQDRELKPEDITITHASPFINRDRARKLWHDNLDLIHNKREFFWNIIITSRFIFDQNTFEVNKSQVQAYCKVRDISTHVEEALRDIFDDSKDKAHAVTDFKIECLSKKADFF